MAQVYTVTASTSVVLVTASSIGGSNVVVLLSSIQYPGHIVGIRDLVGSRVIEEYPVVVSTTNGLQFYDGTISTVIREPYGSLTVSSKDPYTWQLLNNVGYLTSLSNAYLSTLTSQYSYIDLVSSTQDIVSSAIAYNPLILSGINLGGNTQVTGNVTVTGDVNFLSSLYVDKNLTLCSTLFVDGNMQTLSSTSIRDNLTVGGYVSTPQDFVVGSHLQVDQQINAYSAPLSQQLSVQTLKANSMNVFGGILSASDLSTLSSLHVYNSILASGSSFFQSSVSVLGKTAVYDNLYGGSTLQTYYTSTLGFVSVAKDISVLQNALVAGATSTFGDVFITNTTAVDQVSYFRDDIFVHGLSRFKNLDVLGDINISSFSAYSTVRVKYDGLTYGENIFVSQDFRVMGSLGASGSLYADSAYASVSTGISSFTALGVGKDLVVGGTIYGKGNLQVNDNIEGISSLYVLGNLSTNAYNVKGEAFVLSNFYVGQRLITSTLGAPNDLSISTLSLSNTFYIASYGKVPFLTIRENPEKVRAGEGITPHEENIAVEGILYNRSTIDQTSYPDYTKLWYTNQVRTSTLNATNPLSTFRIGGPLNNGGAYPFVANMTTIIHSTMSSVAIYGSTIQASSIQSSDFFGDGTNIQNLGNFRTSIYGSSFFGIRATTNDISAQQLESEFTNVADRLVINQNTFLSTANLFVAGGYDSEINGNIQTSLNSRTWRRGIGPNFNVYAKSVVGNSNISSPIFVATGADTRSLYTIQWSYDARFWNPITSGGFTVVVDGIRVGNSVTYNSNLNIWVAAGNNQGTQDTLLYSTDVFNWFTGNNAFYDSASFVATSPYGFVALGNGIKYSTDGINWVNSATSLTLNTVAYGAGQWLGVSNTTLYRSLNNGLSWLATGYNTIQKMQNMIYDGTNWVGVGCNVIQYSVDGNTWSPVTTNFTPDTIFNAVTFNAFQNTWVAGAVSTTSDKSLWTSDDLLDWSPIQSGGFSTTVLSFAKGYGLFTSSFYTYAAGQASYSGVTAPRQTILQVVANSPTSYYTSNALSLSNSSNVFGSQIRGIYGSINEPFHYVAVGDGDTPQKTIARSIDGTSNSWIPAITGGFNNTGFGITHYNDIWVAVGDALASSNTIQYSPDGANWFGTNNANALRIGGRGIARGIGAFENTLVAVGKDSGKSTMAVSVDGYNWTPAKGSYFTGQGNAVAGGSNAFAPNFVAVGEDSRGFRSTILRSADGLTWTNVLSGGFNRGGFGVAYGLTNTYVAVGNDTNSNKTIQYSLDGGANFTQASSGAFSKAGYAVGFNSNSNVFFAVGEDLGANRNATIKYSGDAFNWSNISSGYGFVSQTTLGAGYSVFTQPVIINEIVPYLEFSNFYVYDRTEPTNVKKANLRVQSSFMVFQEALTINLSTQLIINSNAPYNASTVLTVNGPIYASSFIYTGNVAPSDTLYVSSLMVSTLYGFSSVQSAFLITPSFTVNNGLSRPNFISSYSNSAFELNINNALFTTTDMVTQVRTGILTSTPHYDLEVAGLFGTSNLSTNYVFAPLLASLSSSSGTFVADPYLTFYNASNPTYVNASNLFLTTPSSLTINGVMSLNLSSQKVGFYTDNPQFSLDVRSKAILQSLSTPTLNTSLFFLTLQSV